MEQHGEGTASRPREDVAVRCACCGDAPAPHWYNDDFYCDECAACPECGSPTCNDEEHACGC